MTNDTARLPVIRTAEEISARIEEVKGDDWLGIERSDLVVNLPYKLAQPHLKEDTTQAEFEDATSAAKDVHEQAVAYLDFAIEKIVNHRGISAGRSVSHFNAWLWLLFSDAQMEPYETAEYPQYGAPKIKAAAVLLGAESVWNDAVQANPELARMAEGDLCTPGCDMGCGA